MQLSATHTTSITHINATRSTYQSLNTSLDNLFPGMLSRCWQRWSGQRTDSCRRQKRRRKETREMLRGFSIREMFLSRYEKKFERNISSEIRKEIWNLCDKMHPFWKILKSREESDLINLIGIYVKPCSVLQSVPFICCYGHCGQRACVWLFAICGVPPRSYACALHTILHLHIHIYATIICLSCTYYTIQCMIHIWYIYVHEKYLWWGVICLFNYCITDLGPTPGQVIPNSPSQGPTASVSSWYSAFWWRFMGRN